MSVLALLFVAGPAVATGFGELHRLVPFLAGPIGVGLLLTVMLIGSVVSSPMNTPSPFLEALAISFLGMALPRLASHLSSTSLNLAVLGLLVWVVTFFAMFFQARPYWYTFSFIVVPVAIAKYKRPAVLRASEAEGDHDQ